MLLRQWRAIFARLVLLGVVCLSFTRAVYPQGQPKMRNPFAGAAEAVKEGRRLYVANGCSACHGLTGGGGMGKTIVDDTWVFGSDDETLYKLIKGQIPQQTMPISGAGLPDEQVWKILAYVRSLYKGDPSLINWGSAPSPSTSPSPTASPLPSPSPSPFKPPERRGRGAHEPSSSPWG